MDEWMNDLLRLSWTTATSPRLAFIPAARRSLGVVRGESVDMVENKVTLLCDC